VISEISQNKFTSSLGSRYLFELIPPDIEQREVIEIQKMITDLKNQLIRLRENSFYQIYSIDGKTYLDTDEAISIALDASRAHKAKKNFKKRLKGQKIVD